MDAFLGLTERIERFGRKLFEDNLPTCLRLLSLDMRPYAPGQPTVMVVHFDMKHEDGRSMMVNFGLDGRQVYDASPSDFDSILSRRIVNAAKQAEELTIEEPALCSR